MKKLLYILLGVLFVFTACDKDEESNQIDNSIGLVGYCWVPDGNIYKTINGGQYWSVVNAGNYYSHVSFPSENIGYACDKSGGSDHHKVVKTVNGGVNWSSVYDGDLRWFSFVTNDIGYAHGHADGTWGLYKTTNGGLSWNLVNNNINFSWELSFPTEDVGYCHGMELNSSNDISTVYKTINGGVDFFEVSNQPISNLSFTTEDIGYGMKDNSIYKTLDGGVTWSLLEQDKFLLGFSSADIGYAVTLVDTINMVMDLYSTNDGGSNWDFISNNIPPFAYISFP